MSADWGDGAIPDGWIGDWNFEDTTWEVIESTNINLMGQIHAEAIRRKPADPALSQMLHRLGNTLQLVEARSSARHSRILRLERVQQWSTRLQAVQLLAFAAVLTLWAL